MDEHLAELMKLPAQARARAARQLLESLHDGEEDVDFDEAWREELVRRAQNVQDGTMPTTDGIEVRKRVLDRLATVRRQ